MLLPRLLIPTTAVFSVFFTTSYGFVYNPDLQQQQQDVVASSTLPPADRQQHHFTRRHQPFNAVDNNIQQVRLSRDQHSFENSNEASSTGTAENEVDNSDVVTRSPEKQQQQQQQFSRSQRPMVNTRRQNVQEQQSQNDQTQQFSNPINHYRQRFHEKKQQILQRYKKNFEQKFRHNAQLIHEHQNSRIDIQTKPLQSDNIEDLAASNEISNQGNDRTLFVSTTPADVIESSVNPLNSRNSRQESNDEIAAVPNDNNSEADPRSSLPAELAATSVVIVSPFSATTNAPVTATTCTTTTIVVLNRERSIDDSGRGKKIVVENGKLISTEPYMSDDASDGSFVVDKSLLRPALSEESERIRQKHYRYELNRRSSQELQQNFRQKEQQNIRQPSMRYISPTTASEEARVISQSGSSYSDSPREPRTLLFAKQLGLNARGNIESLRNIEDYFHRPAKSSLQQQPLKQQQQQQQRQPLAYGSFITQQSHADSRSRNNNPFASIRTTSKTGNFADQFAFAYPPAFQRPVSAVGRQFSDTESIDSTINKYLGNFML